jgi:hypothetical protein
MGIERKAGAEGVVPNKFGMWSSVAVIVDQDGATLLMPEKIISKLPENFPLKVISATKPEMTEALIFAEVKFPAVLISDLGKKKQELVQSLQFSLSDRDRVLCSADSTEHVNAVALKSGLDALAVLSKKDRAAAINLLQQIVRGDVSPRETANLTTDAPSVRTAIAATSKDPYQRILLLKMAKKITSTGD